MIIKKVPDHKLSNLFLLFCLACLVFASIAMAEEKNDVAHPGSAEIQFSTRGSELEETAGKGVETEGESDEGNNGYEAEEGNTDDSGITGEGLNANTGRKLGGLAWEEDDTAGAPKLMVNLEIYIRDESVEGEGCLSCHAFHQGRGEDLLIREGIDPPIPN